MYVSKNSIHLEHNIFEIKMSEHPLINIIEDFDLISYYAGVNFAFAEVVALGCKSLALSTPYSEEELKLMLKPTKIAAEKYGILYFVEDKLIITKLFKEEITKNKVVILLAHDQGVLDEYFELKKLKKKSEQLGYPENLELEIAKRFGHLLSYDDATIKRLLS